VAENRKPEVITRKPYKTRESPPLGRCYLTDLGAAHLIGFFAGGEIARIHLHGYNGVLTVFAGVA
jgi:hypothetical protein